MQDWETRLFSTVESIISQKTKNNKHHEQQNEELHECPICSDIGVFIKEGLAYRCHCVRQKVLYKKFKTAKIEGLLREQTFEGFLLKYYSPSEFDQRISGKSYREIATETLQAANDFVSDIRTGLSTKGLLITGPVGSGKTYLSASIANTLIDEGHEVLFLVVPDLLDSLRATFDSAALTTEQQLMDMAREVEVLILDDLGSHNYTEWTRNKLYSIINYRVVNFLSTVVTTNLEIEELEEHLGERTSSRLVELCKVYRLLVDVNIRYQRAGT